MANAMHNDLMSAFDNVAVKKGWQTEKDNGSVDQNDLVILDRINSIERRVALFGLTPLRKKNGSIQASLTVSGDHPLNDDFNLETWLPTVSINGSDRPLRFKFNSINKAMAFIDQFSHYQFD